MRLSSVLLLVVLAVLVIWLSLELAHQLGGVITTGAIDSVAQIRQELP